MARPAETGSVVTSGSAVGGSLGSSGGGSAAKTPTSVYKPIQIKKYSPAPKKFTAKPAAPKTAPKSASQIKKEQASALAKWLAGDTTYQQQVSDFNLENSAYKTNYDRQNQITNRDYATTNRSMERQAGTDRSDQQYDFAGRGILHSGVFAKALGDYNTDYQTKVNNLLQGKTDTLSNAQSDYNNFLRQLKLQQNSAKQDAIRRRSQSLGI